MDVFHNLHGKSLDSRRWHGENEAFSGQTALLKWRFHASVPGSRDNHTLTRSHAHVLCFLICIPNFLRMRFVSHSGCLFEAGICVLACGWTCDKIFHRERKGLNVLGNSIGYGYQAENIVEKIQNWGLQNTQRYDNITYTQTHFYVCVFVFLFFRGTNFLTNIRCKGMFTVQNKLPTSVACYQFPQLWKNNQNSFYSNAHTVNYTGQGIPESLNSERCLEHLYSFIQVYEM